MNYTTRKDYERLWNLVQEGKEVVCWQDCLINKILVRGVCVTEKDTAHVRVGLIHARSKTDFIGQCETANLEFLPPNEWIKIESDKDLPPDEKSVLGWSPNELGRCVVSWNTYFKQWNYHDYRIPKESITHMNKCRYRKQRCVSCRRYRWKKEMSRSNPHLCQSCEKQKRIIENINNKLKED